MKCFRLFLHLIYFSRHCLYNYYKKAYWFYFWVLAQVPKDKNKIQFFDKSQVCCIAIGKEYKSYENGNKIPFNRFRFFWTVN